MKLVDHANQYNNKLCPFLRIDIVSVEPTGEITKLGACFTMNTRITLQWWKPSYWAYLRGMITTDPAWIAWPLAIYFAIRHGSKMKSVDPNNRGH